MYVQIHPQVEEYWGHVNPIGPRACYDEGKRVAETMTYAYAQQVMMESCWLLGFKLIFYFIALFVTVQYCSVFVHVQYMYSMSLVCRYSNYNVHVHVHAYIYMYVAFFDWYCT